jgi:CIC family chloride channel protein
LFVGAALGSCLGVQLVSWMPEMAGSATAYAVVGMGAFLSATTRAPLMAILMVFEMTRQYEVVLPLMLASITANYLALPYGVSMYADSLKRTPRTLPADLTSLALLTPEVSATVSVDATAEVVRKKFLTTPFNHIHVIDQDGHWCGLVVRKSLQTADPRALARDLILPGGRYLVSNMTIQEAVRIASEISSELLPVVEPISHRFLGTVAKSDLAAVMQQGARPEKAAEAAPERASSEKASVEKASSEKASGQKTSADQRSGDQTSGDQTQ